MADVTVILEKIENGDSLAGAELLPLVYHELRRLAAARLARESAAHTLQPTALVHEAWLRLGGDQQDSWRNRRHFLGAAAEAMREILIDQARRRNAVRHGGDLERAGPNALDHAAGESEDDRVTAVSESLQRLAARDPQKAELVKLRYYVGLTIEEAAVAMDISPATAKRWWAFSRAWLAREMHG